MSAQEYKEVGTTAPITPQKPEGGFSRFLNRLFGDPSALQPTSRITQPPPGLEDFAAKIQQGIDGHFATVSQQELERKKAEADRRTAEAEERARVEERQRELQEKERERKEVLISEASRILQDFQVEEKLRYIHQAYWEGKGAVERAWVPLSHISRPSKLKVPAWLIYESEFLKRQEQDWLGGFILKYSYPDFKEVIEYGSRYQRWQFAPAVSSTWLRVDVFWNQGVSHDEKNKKFLLVSGSSKVFTFSIGRPTHEFTGHCIPVEAEDSKSLLEEDLTKETIDRIARKTLPSQLEKRAQEQRSQLPHWQEWIYTYYPAGGD